MSTRVLGPTELRLDVSPELPFAEPAHISASLHLPDLAASLPRAVLICWPGGSYARAYWDMHIAGYPGYSFAEHMTGQGFVVVGADHLGVGASSKPAEGDKVDFDTMSAAAASFVEQVRSSLAEGSPEFGGTPLPEIPIIGFSNHTDTAGLRAAHAAGFDQVLAKSALDEQAKDCVQELLASVD